jgi:hypothetical protein
MMIIVVDADAAETLIQNNYTRPHHLPDHNFTAATDITHAAPCSLTVVLAGVVAHGAAVGAVAIMDAGAHAAPALLLAGPVGTCVVAAAVL